MTSTADTLTSQTIASLPNETSCADSCTRATAPSTTRDVIRGCHGGAPPERACSRPRPPPTAFDPARAAVAPWLNEQGTAPHRRVARSNQTIGRFVQSATVSKLSAPGAYASFRRFPRQKFLALREVASSGTPESSMKQRVKSVRGTKRLIRLVSKRRSNALVRPRRCNAGTDACILHGAAKHEVRKKVL